jgi:hypothetical protein
MAVRKYILGDDGKPVPCEDLTRWGTWHLDIRNRLLSEDDVNGHRVVTLFVGLDQVPLPGAPPALWESEIRFHGQALPDARRHYRSRAEALKGHDTIVNQLRRPPAPEPKRGS